MCTVILAHRVFDDTPVLMGANRDEQLQRPAEAPKLRTDAPIAKVSPRDLKAGGTWLGLNATGVVSAITNRFGKPAADERRSRGELVDRALEHETAAEAAAAIASLDPKDYNGFHLLCVDRQEAHLVWSDGEVMSHSVLSPGIIVLTERSLGAAENKRKERVLKRCRELLDAGDFNEAHLQEVLSDGNEGSIDATCVSIPKMSYGTRSSTILRLGQTNRLLHADGPPSSTDYEDLGAMLEALGC